MSIVPDSNTDPKYLITEIRIHFPMPTLISPNNILKINLNGRDLIIKPLFLTQLISNENILHIAIDKEIETE